MSLEREDGPVKHYRMVCNQCGKQTKRFAGGFYFAADAPKGWKEIEGDEDYEHLCPKCANNPAESTKEIVPNVLI